MRAMKTTVAIGFIIIAAAAISSAGVILTDDFSDGNRTSTPNGGAWYKYGNTTLTTTSNLYLATTSGSLARGAEVNFGAQTLSVGDKLSIRFDMMQNTVSNSIDRVRIGLYDSNGTSLTADTANLVDNAVYIGRVGYFATLDTRTNGATGSVTLRNTPSTAVQLSTAAGQLNLGSSNVNIFDANWDSVVWSIARTGAAEYTIAMSVNGGAEKSWAHSSGGEMTDTFDTFVLFETGGLSSFTIDNFIVEKTSVGM